MLVSMNSESFAQFWDIFKCPTRVKSFAYKTPTVFVGLMGSQKPESSGRLATPVHLRRSGSLSLDPDSFKTTNCTNIESGNH